MGTVKLNRTPAQFWKMTMKELSVLLKEYGRQENERLKTESKLAGFSTACYMRGIEPFKDDEKTIVDNDAGFAGL